MAFYKLNMIKIKNGSQQRIKQTLGEEKVKLVDRLQRIENDVQQNSPDKAVTQQELDDLEVEYRQYFNSQLNGAGATGSSFYIANLLEDMGTQV